MTLTGGDCLRIMRHEIHGPLHESTDTYRTINNAGRVFSGIHEWSWMIRSDKYLDLVGGQDFISLPTDCKKILHEPKQLNNTSRAARFSDLATIMALRSETTSGDTEDTATFHMAAAWRSPVTTGGVPFPVLEIYPTPGDSVDHAFSFVYKTGWTNISTDSEIVQVPDYCEAAFETILRAYVSGIEIGDLEARLQNAVRSQVVMSAKLEDSGLVPSYGTTPRNGCTLIDYEETVQPLPLGATFVMPT